MLELVEERAGGPDASPLAAAMLADLVERHGDQDEGPPTDAKEFVPPQGTLMAAYLDGLPEGRGAVRRFRKGIPEATRVH